MVKLTNKQMSSIYGGASWICTYKTAEMHVCPEDEGGLLPFGETVEVEADNIYAACDMVHEQYNAITVHCARNL